MQDIIFTSVFKKFDSKEVLKNYNARLIHGEINCIFAPSGSGKTTILRILMGLESIDSGTISGLEDLRISAVFQEDRLCENLNPIANILLVAPTCSKDSILAAMNIVGLKDCAFQPVSQLSGGMKRRVAILRAILCDYDILLLDEPMKGLDLATKEKVISYILQKNAGKTVVFVTHDIEEARRMQTKHFLYL